MSKREGGGGSKSRVPQPPTSLLKMDVDALSCSRLWRRS